MVQIDLLLEDERWAQTDLAGLAQSACPAVFAHLKLDGTFEISLLGCDDVRIAALNSEFREKPQPTNVLSWPTTDRAAETPGQTPAFPDPSDPQDLELGDIAIAYDTCFREAQTAEKTMKAHVSHLLVHGTLHLLGYDHINDADATLMESTEIAILAKLGFANPYTI